MAPSPEIAGCHSSIPRSITSSLSTTANPKLKKNTNVKLIVPNSKTEKQVQVQPLVTNHKDKILRQHLNP